jgi:ferredoxin
LHDLLGNALILPPLRDHRDQIPALARHFCKICGACAKNCPYDAIKLNLRLPGHELWEVRHVRTGTGFLVLGLIGGLLSDMLTRTPLYDRITTSVSASAMLNYTMVYLGIIVGVNLLTVLAAALSHRVYRERFLENYSRFALALLPLTCMGVLAFHTHYFLNLGAQLPTLLSQYFSINAVQGLTMEVPREPTLSVQQILIGVGLLWTLITMYLLGRLSPRGRYPRRLGIVPHAVVALILTGVLISVIQQATK